MPWSIFSSANGGDSAAVSWAKSLLQLIGAPTSQGNVNFVYDWERAEGGGGKFNPLNQGPVPGHPELTTTGQQYGGGAADYASWQAGLQGAADYLNMSNFRGILQALRNDQGAQARAALIASPWAASHYGGGSAFPSTPAPNVQGAGGFLPAPPFSSDPGASVSSALGGLGNQLKDLALLTPFLVGGLVLVVLGVGHATGAGRKLRSATKEAVHAA